MMIICQSKKTASVLFDDRSEKIGHWSMEFLIDEFLRVTFTLDQKT